MKIITSENRLLAAPVYTGAEISLVRRFVFAKTDITIDSKNALLGGKAFYSVIYFGKSVKNLLNKILKILFLRPRIFFLLASNQGLLLFFLRSLRNFRVEA